MYDDHPVSVTHWKAALRPEGPKDVGQLPRVRNALAASTGRKKPAARRLPVCGWRNQAMVVYMKYLKPKGLEKKP